MTTYTIPSLDYDYGDLEPYISAEVMKLHYDKHHRGYVDKLNAALADYPELTQLSLVDMLAQAELPLALRNNGGGHYNHSRFWRWMSPDGGGEPAGKLGEALRARYGTFSAFVEAFSAAATTIFGSGWVWLTHDLDIVATPNQDTTMRLGLGEPLLGLDVWEHAYYLDYRNVRADYIKQWWHVVDWATVEQGFLQNPVGK